MKPLMLTYNEIEALGDDGLKELASDGYAVHIVDDKTTLPDTLRSSEVSPQLGHNNPPDVIAALILPEIEEVNRKVSEIERATSYSMKEYQRLLVTAPQQQTRALFGIVPPGAAAGFVGGVAASVLLNLLVEQSVSRELLSRITDALLGLFNRTPDVTTWLETAVGYI